MIPHGWRGTGIASWRCMRCLVYLGSPCLLTLVFWFGFVACIDAPVPDNPPASRIVTAWDPLDCGTPHRVVVELEDEDGEMLTSSTVCGIGSITLDVPHFGIYRGRIYAWEQLDHAAEIRSVMPIRLAVDETVVRWFVTTPR